MIKGLVTIVLPIYNVEKYLNRCMESVVNQTYKNIEIIMVDDGSPDSCPAMCDEWAQKDSRIKVVHKENAGLGMARNTGIEHATGEYILFFDSDDYVRLDTVEKLYQQVSENGADILVFGHYTVNERGAILSTTLPHAPRQRYEGAEIRSDVYSMIFSYNLETGKRSNLSMSAWANMYSMALIERTGWRFVPEREIIAEDLYSLLDLYAYIQRVVIVEDAFYYYCKNEASLTRTYRKDRFEKIKVFYDKCIALFISRDYGEQLFVSIKRPYISFVVGALKQIMQAAVNRKERKRLVYDIFQDEQLQAVLQGDWWKDEPFIKRILYSCICKKRYYFAYIILFWWAKLKK